MEVAREKIVAPSLLDIVAQRPMLEPHAGPSFQECLQAPPPAPPPPTRSSSEPPRSRRDDPPSSSPKLASPPGDDQPRPPSESPPPTESAKSPAPDDDPDSTEELETSQTEETVVVTALPATPLDAPPDSKGEEMLLAAEAVPNEELTPLQQGQAAKKRVKPTTAIELPGEAVSELEEGVVKETATQPVKAVAAKDTLQTTSTVVSTAAVAASLDEGTEANAALPSAAASSHKSKARRAIARSSEPVGDDASPQTVENAATKRRGVESANPTASSGKIPLDPAIELAAHKTDIELPVDVEEPRRAMWQRQERDASLDITPAADVSVADLSPAATSAADAASLSSAPQEAPSSSTGPQETGSTVGHASPVPKAPAALLRGKGSAPQSSSQAAEIDPARFLNRVVKAFESAHQRDGEVRLRLHPAELGSLSIEVKVQDSILTARLQAETPEARAALVDNLPVLRERLAEQGIRIDKFDVDLMDHSDRRGEESLRDQAHDEPARRPTAERAARARAAQPERPAASSTMGPHGGKGLNVVV